MNFMDPIVISALIMIVLYIAVGQFYFRIKLGIKPRGFVLSGRNKLFEFIDYAMVFLAFGLLIGLNVYYQEFNMFHALPIYILFVIWEMIKGFEQRRDDKQAKTYYHEWLAAAFMFLFILIIVIDKVTANSLSH